MDVRSLTFSFLFEASSGFPPSVSCENNIQFSIGNEICSITFSGQGIKIEDSISLFRYLHKHQHTVATIQSQSCLVICCLFYFSRTAIRIRWNLVSSLTWALAPVVAKFEMVSVDSPPFHFHFLKISYLKHFVRITSRRWDRFRLSI